MSGRMAASDRLRRLLVIIPWLAERGGATVAEVAERFGMSDEEVLRELELASCCGLPPYSPDRLIEVYVDEDDVVQVGPGPFLERPPRFTPSEGFAVATAATALLAVPGADPAGPLARALAKLQAVLPAVDVALDQPPLLGQLQEAVTGRRRLHIEYYSLSQDAVSERDIDPYAVHAHDGRWYTEAWCHRAQGTRRFRVDRIASAVDTGETFPAPVEVPSVPDEVFTPGAGTEMVELDLPASGRWVMETYPVVSAEPVDDRWRVKVAVASRAWLERVLLRLGGEARVVSPAELADVGRAAARRVLARYAS